MHVHADRYGGIATRQAARRNNQVVRGRHAEATELDGDRRGEVAGGLERVDRLERVGAVAVVLGCAGGELLGELLGDRHKAGAGFGMGFQFNWHGGSPVRSSRARGRRVTPATSQSES